MSEVVEYGSLAENEQVIEKGMTSFVEVGRALAAIRDDGQYVTAGFDTFEDYCRDRWDLTAGHARRQIDAAQVAALTERAHGHGPPAERVARPLVKMLNEHGEEAVVSAWSQIVEKHDGDGPITGREVSGFLTLGANYGKPGWNELLGEVGDSLVRAEKQLTKVEQTVTRRGNEHFRTKADTYAGWAAHLTERLRSLAGGND